MTSECQRGAAFRDCMGFHHHWRDLRREPFRSFPPRMRLSLRLASGHEPQQLLKRRKKTSKSCQHQQMSITQILALPTAPASAALMAAALMVAVASLQAPRKAPSGHPKGQAVRRNPLSRCLRRFGWEAPSGCRRRRGHCGLAHLTCAPPATSSTSMRRHLLWQHPTLPPSGQRLRPHPPARKHH